MSSENDSVPIGEVIAAATAGFTAQVTPPPRPPGAEGGPAPVPDPPPFGALVRIGPVPGAGDAVPLPDDFDPFETVSPAPLADDTDAPATLYGVVCQAEIGALEGGRPLTAYGLDEDELRREQPQIFELLTARFTAALVAYAAGQDGGQVRPFLPPRPPRPHARVFACTPAETVRVTARLDYLRPLLLGTGSVMGVAFPPDELAAALLRGAARAHRAAGEDPEAFLERAGRELAALLTNDYERLRAIIRRVVS